MRLLLVYPEYPRTFWSFHYALKFISKKASFPPLGLLTVASLIPADVEKKLVDMNVEKLNDKDIKNADYVFISAMTIQKASVLEVIERCKKCETKIVAGGPLFTVDEEDYSYVDHLVLNEGEITLPMFFKDLEAGHPKHIYKTDQVPDLETTPLPDWDLINMNRYSSMCVQYSRGCPFNCDFCNITSLFGHIPRTKGKEQILLELDALYIKGWRGGVFFVDDNFIGNKAKLKDEILPAIIIWMKERDYPFRLSTEVSINLAEDDILMTLMGNAGFDGVFVGIETPNESSLVECNKTQNKNKDMLKLVKKIQNSGMRVQGGFILGFDNDPNTIFKSMINFIQNSGIVTAMVGLLNAPKGTKLYKRMQKEGRLKNEITGDNTDMTINFSPKMEKERLLKGYKEVLTKIYSTKQYYERIRTFLKEYKPIVKRKHQKMKANEILAFLKSIVRLGIIGKERLEYWKLLFWTLFHRPGSITTAITYIIYGFHFRKIYSC